MDKKPVIELKNVSKIYKVGDEEVKALDRVNLKIYKGEFVSIIGPSGSGKSTLLHIMGVLDKPTTGEVYIDGERISKLRDEEIALLRNKKIGFVFQFFNLYPTLTALENVELPMMISGLDENERRERAEKLLDEVGLLKFKNHLPSQLSGGQRQKVAIARAMANDPRYILADEPTGNLDSKSGEEIIKTFKHLNEKHNKTIIVVTHNLELTKYFEKIIKIRDGKIVEVKDNGKK
ncbi:MAG: ABC transporter ATP-binding protein [Candidatus Aenigmarchaeota archaeon]|nr:ABC transporter ATP-binding protein [Candidatus Aenigmarchaeota archaeon]MDW8160038.1 ABC transporter ATP-binding protein [Candidatus Aenigmarchaeota archaeon]